MSLGDALARCGNTDRSRAVSKIVAREGYSAMKSQVTVVKLPPAKLWEPANSIFDIFRIVCAADKNHFTPSPANISAKLDARTIYLAKF
jgi:hypothetical protein